MVVERLRWSGGNVGSGDCRWSGGGGVVVLVLVERL